MTAPGRRVLFVDHAGVLGGAEFSLLDIVPAFMPGSAALLLSDGPFRAELEKRGIPVEVEPLGALGAVRKRSLLPSFAALRDMSRVKSLVAERARKFDVVYANSQKAFAVAGPAAARAAAPLIWHLRDILGPPHFRGLNSRFAAWWANWHARRVIANSRATADAFIAAGGKSSLVRVVHNGIDAAPFDAVTDSDARAVRSALGVPDGAPLAVHVGRFHEWKGQRVLLEALRVEPRARAWVVGAPLFGEEEYAADLRAYASTLGVADRVSFLGFRDDVPALLRAADIVVHSSIYPEPFGRVVVEGMLARRPVIATSLGGIPEIITDGETGVLVPAGDSGALARALGALIDDPARAAAIAARGSVHARTNFTRAAMVRGVTEVVASL